MKAILFGFTGMVGQGVLRECLLDPEVEPFALERSLARAGAAIAEELGVLDPPLRDTVVEYEQS